MIQPTNFQRLAAGIAIGAFLIVGGCKGNQSDSLSTSSPLTPKATSVSTLPDGWKETKTSGIAIAFPGDWKTLDFTVGDLDKAMDSTFGTDPNKAGLVDSIKQMAKAGVYKLFVLAPKNTPANFRPNANVVMLDSPTDTSLDDQLKLNMDQMKQLTAPGATLKSSYVDIPSGKVARIDTVISSPQNPQITDICYIAVKGKRSVFVSFSTTPESADEMNKVAEQSIKTFKFD